MTQPRGLQPAQPPSPRDDTRPEEGQVTDLPEATVARLPEYLRALHAFAEAGHDTVSSEALAAAAGVNSAKLRKDLSHLGSYGTRGVGYEVEVLVGQIESVLGLTERRSVALVGVGNLGHALVRFPISVAGFSIAVTWWSGALGGLSYGLWEWSLPDDVRGRGLITADDRGLLDVLGVENTDGNRIVVYTIIGALFAVTLPAMMRLCALVEAWVAQGMLNGVAGLRGEVAASQQRTVAAVSAEATALRRLERDLHDGPQQRLVRLAVDLGRARHQLENDPTTAAATVDEALVQAREALDELRTLSRGIAPPILTDRGLAAAVAALAAPSTVSVRLSLVEERLPALAEQTAYFTIAEALANIAKHSGASTAEVSASRVDGRLAVTVTDDGRGGAHLAKGHGLAGLDDRLRAAGGTLEVTSPVGGPTTVRAEIPVE